MQISIKPIFTQNIYGTASKQSSNGCNQFCSFESSPNKDCFIKSSNNKSAVAFGNYSMRDEVNEYELNPESRNPLNKDSYKIALQNVDIPIRTVDEYKVIIERIKNSKMMNGNSYYNFNSDLNSGYKNINETELGLLSYVGGYDVSNDINKFLSGRFPDLRRIKIRVDNGLETNCLDRYTPENYGVMEDLVRALDYSLDKVDEEFGIYDGIVYRSGYMDSGCGQYYSTSTDPNVAAKIGNFDYSVIRTKSGHKIVDFQRKMESEFANTESEILLDRKSKYRELSIEECDKELLNARETLADSLFKAREDSLYLSKFNREQLRNLIKVYEEI